MKKIFIFLLFSFICQVGNSQTIFQQFYGSGKGIFVDKTNDGFLLIAENDTNYLKITTDVNGNLINTTNLGAKTNKIIHTADDGFAKFTAIPDSLGAKIEKLDASGNTIWTKNYQFFPIEKATDFIQTNDGGFAFVTTIFDSAIIPPQLNKGQVNLIKINAVGDVEWNSVTDTSQISAFQALLVQKTDGSFVLSTLWKNNFFGTAGLQLLHFSASGDYQNNTIVKPAQSSAGSTALHKSLQLQTTEDNHFIYTYYFHYTTPHSSSVGIQYAKEDEWDTDDISGESYGVGTLGNYYFYSTIPTSDGGAILCTNSTQWGIGGNPTDTLFHTLRKVDQLGNTSWIRTTPDKVHYGIELDNHYYALTGEQDSLIYLLLMDGDQGVSLTGKIVADLNNNCQADADEEGIGNWVVSASTPTSTFYGLSDTLGNYSIALPLGSYDVIANSLTDYWEETCTGTAVVTVTDYANLDTVNFFPHPVVECPSLNINISSPTFHACDTLLFMVDYENIGTNVANDVFAEISFHEKITIDSASIPYANTSDNIYNFTLPALGVGEDGQFQIYAHLACDAVVGQTLFAQAKIFPDEFCNTPPQWDQSHISITGVCEMDSVAFYIKNTGTADMQDYVQGIIIEDEVLGLTAPIKVDAGDTKAFRFAKNGTSYYFMADQPIGHPGHSMPRVAIEGCGTNTTGTFSTGHVLPYPEDDEDFFVSMDQKEVLAPDTSVAVALNFPVGYGVQHYINANQSVEYHISFENAKDDTITHVVINNIISNNLDLSTLKMGASSHPYRLRIIGDTLQFIFENIQLLKSTDNIFKSNGFVDFKLDQKQDLSNGTIIHNSSLIFFDQDTAIVPAPIFNTIGKDFVIVANDIFLLEKLSIQAIPNPVTDFVQFKIDHSNYKEGQLEIMTSSGQKILTRTLNSNTLTIPKNLLPKGVLFFTITLDNHRHTGKIIVL